MGRLSYHESGELKLSGTFIESISVFRGAWDLLIVHQRNPRSASLRAGCEIGGPLDCLLTIVPAFAGMTILLFFLPFGFAQSLP